jgi:hypothetical protein
MKVCVVTLGRGRGGFIPWRECVEAEWDTLLAELCAPRFAPTINQLEGSLWY